MALTTGDQHSVLRETRLGENGFMEIPEHKQETVAEIVL